MGVLDNTSVTVDAILTKKGREKLAKGEGQFRITKFALGDDEIDYNLYDVTHPNGSNFYGQAIENMNLLEAVPDQNLSLRFKLTDVSNGSGGSTTAYVMSLTPATTTLDDNRTSVNITPTISGYDGEYAILKLASLNSFILLLLPGPSLYAFQALLSFEPPA